MYNNNNVYSKNVIFYQNYVRELSQRVNLFKKLKLRTDITLKEWLHLVVYLCSAYTYYLMR